MRSESGKRLALLSGSVLFGLLLLELVVRLIEPSWFHREPFERHDAVLHHRFIPGAQGRYRTTEFDAAYVINSLGLRDRETSREKPAGVSRILMLGDSFTEGNGVEAEEAFSGQLQVMLDQAGLGKRWQVINAGVGSYSPLLEYLYLKNGGLSLQPDLVILSFDLSDVYDDIHYAQLALFDADGEPVAVRGQPLNRPWPLRFLVAIKDLLKKHSRIYSLVRRRLDVKRIRQKSNFSGDFRFDKYAMLREDVEPQDDRDWTLSYQYLLKIRDLLRSRGIHFWVVVYPYGHQISREEWGIGRAFWGFETGKVYSTRAQDLVEQFCRRNGIRVINTCEDFRETARSIYPLYFENDGHWRPAGHTVVANILYRVLVPYLREREADHTAGPPGEPHPASTH
jgi:hypothetical protein